MIQFVSPDRLASEVTRRLSSTSSVIIPTKGASMIPFIIGEDRVELVRPGRLLAVGMVVLARTETRGIVLHRVVDIQGETITLMGDGNLSLREKCKISDLIGIATYIINSDGSKKYIYTRRRQLVWRFWYRCLPIRRWLLRLV